MDIGRIETEGVDQGLGMAKTYIGEGFMLGVQYFCKGEYHE